MRDRVHQDAVVWFSGRDHLAGVTSATDSDGIVETETTLRALLARRVATLATLHQNRPDLRLEEIKTLVRFGRWNA